MKTISFSFTAILVLILSVGCSKKSESQLYIGSTAIDTTSVITGLDTPWEVLWGPDNHLWITERYGRISRLNPDTGGLIPVYTIPEVDEYGEGGLLGMALHPDFQTEPYVYLVYNYYSGEYVKERLVRYLYDGTTLTDPLIILNNVPANSYHNGSRLIFGPDGCLYMSTGDAGNLNSPQNMNSLNGKILRIRPDGTIPDDNPFSGSYIWALGLRNTQGLVFTPSGKLYGSEHGPSTDDEMNLLEPARNFGWPTVAGFCDLPGETDFCESTNVKEPLAAWTPTLAVAGTDYYNHAAIPEWENSLLMTSLKAGKLVSLQLSSDGNSITEQQDWFTNHYGRLRDVCVAPDGRVFIAVSNRDGRGTPRPGDDRIVEVRATGATGISDSGKNDRAFSVYPNPVNSGDFLNIHPRIEQGQFAIYNGLGMKVKEGSLDHPLRIGTADLKQGFYLLRIRNGNDLFSKTFIVL